MISMTYAAFAVSSISSFFDTFANGISIGTLHMREGHPRNGHQTALRDWPNEEGRHCYCCRSPEDKDRIKNRCTSSSLLGCLGFGLLLGGPASPDGRADPLLGFGGHLVSLASLGFCARLGRSLRAGTTRLLPTRAWGRSLD